MSDPKPTGVYMLKWLDENGCGIGGPGYYRYDLPKDGNPGKWHSINNKDRIKVCQNRFHCTSLKEYRLYSEYGPRLFIVEVAGSYDIDITGYKAAFKHIRIVEEVLVNSNGTAMDRSRKPKLLSRVTKSLCSYNIHGIIRQGGFK